MGCKVDSLTERHGLTVPDSEYASVDDFLVARWTGRDGRSSEGYKSLTEWFNKRLLKRMYDAQDRDAIGAHLDTEYEVITGEPNIQRDELAADLAADDIDIDRVNDEFVSWSTMRHHLKGCLDAEKESPRASTDWEANTVRKAREQTERKTRSVLSSLSSKSRLHDAERAEVDVQVKLSCPECSVRIPFEEALDRGYVCETHFETDDEEPVRERWQTTLSALVVPYGVLESVQRVLLEDPFLLESLLPPVF